MADVLTDFLNKKDAESQFLSLKNSGDNAKIVKLTSIEMVTKPDFTGTPKEVLRLTVEVETSEGIKTKVFDNGTRRFVETLQKSEIKLGDSFTLLRSGEGTETRYVISDVVHHAAA